jgi:hypothetical protein
MPHFLPKPFRAGAQAAPAHRTDTSDGGTRSTQRLPPGEAGRLPTGRSAAAPRRARRGGSPPAEARRLPAGRNAAAPRRPRRGGSPPAEARRLPTGRSAAAPRGRGAAAPRRPKRGGSPAGRSAVAPRRRTRHRRRRDRTGPAPAANRVIDSGLPQRARRPEMKGLSPRNAVQLRQSGIGRRSEDGLPTSRSTSCDLAPN